MNAFTKNLIVYSSTGLRRLCVLSAPIIAMSPLLSGAMTKPLDTNVFATKDVSAFSAVLADRQHSLIGSDQCAHVRLTKHADGDRLLIIGADGQSSGDSEISAIKVNFSHLPNGDTETDEARTTLKRYKVTYINTRQDEFGNRWQSDKLVVARYFDLIDYLRVEHKASPAAKAQIISCRNVFVKKQRKSGRGGRA